VLGANYDQVWDWDAAGKEFERALQLDPNNARAHVLYGIHFDTLGDFANSLKETKRGVELDPLNLTALDNLAQAYESQRQWDLAIEQSRKNVELNPNFANSHGTLSHLYAYAGKNEDWLREWEKNAELNHDRVEMESVAAAKIAYAHGGAVAANRAVCAKQQTQAQKVYVDPALTAVYCALGGEKEKAFALLEKAIAEKSGFLGHIKSVPAYDSLRSDPRYAELLKKMGLPQ